MKKNRLQRSDVLWGLLVAGLVILQFWWLPGDKGTATDSYSNTLDGKLGIYRTLGQLFPAVERNGMELYPDYPATVLMIAPDRYPTDVEQRKLYEFVYNGGTLLFAPNWIMLPPDWTVAEIHIPLLHIQLDPVRSDQRSRPVQVVAAGASPNTSSIPAESALSPGSAPPETEPPMPAEKPEAKEIAEVPPAAASVVQTQSEDATGGDAVESATTSPLVTDPINWRTRSKLILPEYLEYQSLVSSAGTTEVATWSLGSGRVTVCSSPDVFSNRSMLDPVARRLAVRLVEQLHQHLRDVAGHDAPIVLNEFLNASDSYRNTGVLFSPALRIGTLQLTLLAVLTLWFGFHRFGPAVVAESGQRRTLVDSAMAVGNLQFRLHDGGAVLKNYLEYIRSQLRRRYGSAVKLDQTDAIAIRAGMDVEEVRRNLAEAQRLAAAPSVPPARTAAMLRWLSELQNRLARTQSS